jgi:hypothetical protein
MDLASLFSSIILSRPKALAEPFRDRFLELTEEDDEWLDPSRLGVGLLLTVVVLLGSRCSTGHSIVSFCGGVFLAGATWLGAAFSTQYKCAITPNGRISQRMHTTS